MTDIKPFKGVLYNGEKAEGGYSGVLAPPYDVISEKKREELYNKSRHNIIRLILGKDRNGDSRENNKYTRAGKYLDEWQNKGVLVRDEKEAFYVYLQEYTCNGEQLRRIGFIGLMKIESPEKDPVLPHEHTLVQPKKDRMNLIKEVRGNLSPIFTLYEDPTGKIKKILEECIEDPAPVIDVVVDGERNAVWRLLDERALGQIVSGMDKSKIFIADGHHRYAVARAYRDLRIKQNEYDDSADHIMMYFSDLSEKDNLTILATHRVIRVMPDLDENKLRSKLSEYFDITECADLNEILCGLKSGVGDTYSFGVLAGEKYMLVQSKDKETIIGLITEDRARSWKELDVSVLHSAVFDSILSVDKVEGNITYVRAPDKAEELIRNKTHMAAFILNPTRIEQMKAVAELGEMMPQKSTYFYPKLLTGLVINKFDPERSEKTRG